MTNAPGLSSAAMDLRVIPTSQHDLFGDTATPPHRPSASLGGTRSEAPTLNWLPVAVSPDPSDPKLAHLDGLNLSRAWMLEGIASALPEDDPRRFHLLETADAHRRAGLDAVTGAHYQGGHWLGSFAIYLTTQRGIQRRTPGPR